MNRRTGVLLSVVLLAAYIGSYLFYSRDGAYVPGVFGAAKGADGRMVLRSKRFGKIWEPFGSFRSAQDYRTGKILGMVYLPLVFIDRRLWHRMQRETEDSYYGDYF